MDGLRSTIQLSSLCCRTAQGCTLATSENDNVRAPELCALKFAQGIPLGVQEPDY